MNHIIRYRSFGSPDVLEEANVPLSEPQGADVRVRIHAVGLNPVDYKTFNGDLRALEHLRQLAHPLRRTPMFPRGVGRDFSGVITAVGPSATGYSVGDPVLGTLRSAPGQIVPQGTLATEVIAPTETITAKPEGMSYQTAASLGVAAETACVAFRRLHLAADDVIVIIAAAGGVGSLASQLALTMGATVVGIAGRGNADYLRSLGGYPRGVRTRPGNPHRPGQPGASHKTPRLLRQGVRAARSGPAHPQERQGHSGPVTRRAGPGGTVHWGAARAARRPGESRPTGGVGAHHDPRGQRVPHDPGRGPGGVHGARRRSHAWENRCHG